MVIVTLHNNGQDKYPNGEFAEVADGHLTVSRRGNSLADRFIAVYIPGSWKNAVHTDNVGDESTTK